jgi:LacI family transcriptional regulator
MSSGARARPRLADIAEQAGVSRATVSVILNGRAAELRIAPETRTSVLNIARELGYVRNLAARRLRVQSRAQHRLSVTIASPFDTPLALLAPIIEGIQRAAYGGGTELDVGVSSFHLGRLTDVRPVFESALNHGVLVVGTSVEDDAFLNATEFPIPIVVIQRRSRYASVITDDELGGLAMTRHLLALGRTRVALMMPRLPIVVLHDRAAGYLRAHAEMGVVPDPALIVGAASYSLDAGYLAAQSMLASGLAFDALFCLDDQLAVGAARAFREAGLKLPADVALAGYCDHDVSDYVEPPLSSVRIPLVSMALEATNMLVRSIRRQTTETERVTFRAELVLRASTTGRREVQVDGLDPSYQAAHDGPRELVSLNIDPRGIRR